MNFDMNILINIIKFSSPDTVYEILKVYPRLINPSLDLHIIKKTPSQCIKKASMYIRFTSNDIGFLERCIKLSNKLLNQSAIIQNISWYDGYYKIKYIVLNIELIFNELMSFISNRFINKHVHKCGFKMYQKEYVGDIKGMYLFETKDKVYPVVNRYLKLNNTINKEIKIKLK